MSVLEHFPLIGFSGRVHDTMGAPRHGRPGGHRGTDLPAPRGTPIVAMRPGRVVRVHSRVGEDYCGLGISIEGPDRVRYTYCHMALAPANEHGDEWEVGDTVRPGDMLGIVGTTTQAGHSVGPHLHIQAIRGSGAGAPVNLAPQLAEALARETGRPQSVGIMRPAPDDAWGWLAPSPSRTLAVVAILAGLGYKFLRGFR
jgi:murein DD-endopeptidase MepM/ murein hydrolase activator NlpD